MHCNDANCAGGGESIASLDTVGDQGAWTSLALDASGNPVISYLDGTNADLKLLHCNDANCVGGGESFTSPDTAGNVGHFTSLALDGSGNPVVSYGVYNGGSDWDLKLMHCNDANCAGGDESITTPDTGDVADFSSLALDASGNPVVSYRDFINGDLKLMHCNDANCAGGDESITLPDTVAAGWTSLALDASGNPVVSYHDITNADLRLMHCNDANCSPGGDSFTSPDTGGEVGRYTSLALDAGGNPVVSYCLSPGTQCDDLKVLHCNDANCAGGDDSITAPDTAANAGSYTSLALDASGDPVVSYRVGNDLGVLHCGDPNCTGAKPPTPTATATATSTATPTATPTPTPEPRQLSIINIGQYALPKTCFQVRDAAQTPLFSVCDNDFQGAPESDPACMPDGICSDDDPALGSIAMPVTGADYRVVESKVPFNHTAASGKQTCDATVTGCSVTFTNTPGTKPWFPWDVNGDGVVNIPNDILGVAGHFGQSKP